MTNVKGALGLAGLAWCVASGALAQAVTAETMATGRIERNTVIRLDANVDYDSNLLRSMPISAAPGSSASDIIYTPTLTTNVVLPIGRQVAYLQGTAGYVFHQRNTRLDTQRFDIRGGTGLRLGPCGTLVGGGYRRGRSELDDRTLVETINNILEVKTADVGITCLRAPGLGVTATYQGDWADNSAAQVKMSDYRTNAASAGIIYSRPAIGTFSLQAQYSRTDYPNRNLPFDSDGYEQKGVAFRAERQVGARIQATAGISYVEVRQDRPPVPLPGALPTKDSFSGFTYVVSANFRATSRLQLSVDAERATTPSIVQGGGFEIVDSYAARIQYRLGSRVSLSLGADQEDQDVRQGTVLLPVNRVTSSRTRSANAAITYRQNRHISLSLRASAEDRDSDNTLFDYSAERVGLSVGYNF